MSDETTHDEKRRQQHEYSAMEKMSVRESAKFAFKRPPYSVVEDKETDNRE